jgi:hypothetical protein
MDWSECNKNSLVKKSTRDVYRIKSLINSSKDRLTTNERIILDEVSSSTKISNTYDALREILEAVALEKGYKVYNHECYCSFLKEICNEEKISEQFNRFRIVRNNTSYYGKKVETKEAEKIIEDMVQVYNLIFNKYFKQ